MEKRPSTETDDAGCNLCPGGTSRIYPAPFKPSSKLGGSFYSLSDRDVANSPINLRSFLRGKVSPNCRSLLGGKAYCVCSEKTGYAEFLFNFNNTSHSENDEISTNEGARLTSKFDPLRQVRAAQQ